jgi:hypothetical protein
MQIPVQYIAHGPFWLRGQAQSFLWDLRPDIQRAIKQTLVAKQLVRAKKYVACHIRNSDNVKVIKRDFGIDAMKANSLSTCMAVARRIRDKDPELRTIFIATDNSEVIQDLPTDSPWKFIFQSGKHVTRTANIDSKFAWFRHKGGKSAIITDIELMRKADYVVGSMISNVFRLVAELRDANPELPVDSLKTQRVFSVDVEWYEDP